MALVGIHNFDFACAQNQGLNNRSLVHWVYWKTDYAIERQAYNADHLAAGVSLGNAIAFSHFCEDELAIVCDTFARIS